MKKLAILLLMSLAFIKNYSQTYKITDKINIKGDEGWDYLTVDEVNQHLFVSHGNVVNVIDIATNNLIANIPDTKGVHGIAIAYDLNEAFISNGKDNSVTVVNLKTLEFVQKIKIEGQKPDAILYDPFSHAVLTYNAKSKDATVIDTHLNKVIKTIPLNGTPEFSVTNEKGLIYVNIEDKNQIKVIDATTFEVVNTWSIAPGEEPSGLAIDNETNRLFSVCSNKLLIIIDAINGKNIKTLPIGAGCDGVAFDNKNKLLFSSNGEGTVTVIKEKSDSEFSVLQTVATQRGARTIALNKSTGQLFLPTAEYVAKPQQTLENQHPKSIINPNSFVVLVLDSKGK